ncbi:MAG: ATP-dependent metallopeptidase FtsH/Yme1/Tma family protein, partial [Rickettsiales bacterium]|nr:ATP-dependent metallopeptidase FtsH/Yme1/Tma family protein [Rickettsiales bacterium]
MKGLGKTAVFWLSLFFLIAMVYNAVSNVEQQNLVPFSDFLDEVDNGAIEEAVVRRNTIEFTRKDGSFGATNSLHYPNLVDMMRQQSVKVVVKPDEEQLGTFWSIVISWFPILLLIGVYVFFMRQMQSGSGKAMGFGKSKARLLTEKTQRVTFEDVAGVEEAKEELTEVVDFLRDPKK